MVNLTSEALVEMALTRGGKNLKRSVMHKFTTKPVPKSHPTEAKHLALRYILDAWEEAVYEGLDPDCIATAAIFAALSDMVATYGEEPVAVMCERLPERIRTGEFSVAQTKQ
jgi:predicted YcjX-like family ATPase